jgi:hypothetical protein
MSRKKRGARAATYVGVTVTASLVAAVTAVLAGAAGTSAAPTSLSVSATADTYVYQEYPTENRGSATKLTASDQATLHTRAYLKFSVRGLPAAAAPAAHLRLSSDRNQPAAVELHSVASTSWDAGTMTMQTAPAVGPVVATATGGAGQKSLDFDLTGTVRTDGDYAFALVEPQAGAVSAVFSSEHGADGPTLALTWAGAPTSPAPTAPAPAPTSPAPAPASGTLFGETLYTGAGTTPAQALARETAAFGPPQVIRSFYSGMPAAWPGAAGVSGGPVVVSFKALPRDVLSGRLDTQFATWFGTAPKDRPVIWSYFHEPENDIEAGSFTAADYRAAWVHLAALADRAGNPRLRANLILMCWTLEPASHRTFTDYFPGPGVVDGIGWDCYSESYKKGGYTDPAAIFGKAVAKTRALGLPWGMAEVGSQLAVGDDGTARARWLLSVGAYARAQGAQYATYFDAPVGGEFRLTDTPSRNAWRQVLAG